MIIKNMDEFQDICREKLVDWFNNHRNNKINKSNTFIVWSCKTLQNYKLLASTDQNNDTTYAEYTYNGEMYELYEDIYTKQTHTKYD